MNQSSRCANRKVSELQAKSTVTAQLHISPSAQHSDSGSSTMMDGTSDPRSFSHLQHISVTDTSLCVTRYCHKLCIEDAPNYRTISLNIVVVYAASVGVSGVYVCTYLIILQWYDVTDEPPVFCMAGWELREI